MKRSGLPIPLYGLISLSLLAAACTESDDTDGDGAGGAAGEHSGPTAGTSGDASPGGEGGGASCSTNGSGTLVIEVEGLPDGLDAAVGLDGPTPKSDASGSVSLDAGIYIATAARVYDEDSIVRTVYAGTITTPSLCVAEGTTRTLKVSYAPIASSNKLWMPSGKDAELTGFAAADIAETVMTDASVAIDTPGIGSIAFDRDGNLWATGTTIGEDMLVRFPAAELGASGTGEPDIEITVPEITEFPYINHIAFDPLGNLWLSASGDQLHRINASDLGSSGEKSSDVLFTEVVNNTGIAFDAAGNLWVAGGPTIERFDQSRLDISDVDAPDLEIKLSSAIGNTVLGAEELVFDKAGNLWGVAGSTVFQIASTDLEGTGVQEVKANVSFDIDTLALPSTPVFDEGNGLWLSLTPGSFGRFAPETLGRSVAGGTPVDPDVLISSDSIDTQLPLAFFPAPEGLPLYHSLPAE